MPPLVSSSKALLSRTRGCCNHRFQKYVPGARCLSGSSSIAPGVKKLVNSDELHTCSFSNNYGQVRGFLGVGDGEEGSVLSKIHKENRILGYTPEQLFAVVAAVDMYEDFLPWCQRSKIVQRNQDGSFNAELEIGFKFFVESYMSRVDLNKPKSIKTTASQSNLFDHLINNWEFRPGPVPGSCDLYFLVDFKFQSPLYGQVASFFFKEVVSRLVQSFSDRCRLIYGPGVQIVENKCAEQRM